MNNPLLGVTFLITCFTTPDPLVFVGVDFLVVVLVELLGLDDGGRLFPLPGRFIPLFGIIVVIIMSSSL